MKKMIPILALLALSLTGCAFEAPGAPTKGYVPDEQPTYVRVEQVVTPEGEVTCVIYEGFKSGGVTCDWDNPVVR